MRVRIVKPAAETVDEVDVANFRQGHVYDLPAALAAYLVLRGWAQLELRKRDRDGSNDRDFRGWGFA